MIGERTLSSNERGDSIHQRRVKRHDSKEKDKMETFYGPKLT